MDSVKVHQAVKEYYSGTIQTANDLKTSACCCAESVPLYIRDILKEVDAEILNKFYGCGSPIPPALNGCAVLDLGCGSGRDTYVTAKLVGEQGRVIGVDMIEDNIRLGRRQIAAHMQRFGFSAANVEFKQGYIEDLAGVGIRDNSLDVVISNCVINLSPDKKAVFSEIFRMLKPGGELYFSDVFTGSRIPERFKSDKVLLGECLAGALYIEDFRRMLSEVGCLDYRVAAKRKMTLDDPEIVAQIGMIDFYSITIRAFKLDTLEDICEDYGQTATYLGTIPETPHRFILDVQHVFRAGKPLLVCGNTASMLKETRYAKHFKITGDRSAHYGRFACGPAADKVDGTAVGSCC